MSQPVAVLASVKMQETEFKRMLRTKAIKEFASVIEKTIFYNIPNYYIFRYLKKEQRVFAYFFFNHGNKESLNESMNWLPIKELVLFSDKEDAGYIFSTLDALGVNKEDIHHMYMINNNEINHITEIPNEVLKQCFKDINKYFFKEVDKDFANNFYKSRIVDKGIVKLCKKFSEERRVKDVLVNLDKASFIEPLHIFGDYYFNGKYIYYKVGKCAILKEINSKTFIQTPYGAADENHVVVEGKVVKANPALFKKLQKGELIYYLNKEKVFNSELEEIEEADPKSFKIINEYHSVDVNAVYFAQKRLTKESIGKYKIHLGGYYNHEKILEGEKAVYFGDNLIDVDAASFKVVDTIKRKYLGIYGSVIYIAKDKRGQMLLYSDYDKRGMFSQYNLIRMEDPMKFISELEQKDKENWNYRINYFPPNNMEDIKKYYDEFTKWKDIYFDEFYKEYKTRVDIGLYQKINNYFFACFELNKCNEIISLYEEIKETAWLNPYLFHHTACAYTALGEYEKALGEIKKAIIYGYEKVNKIFADMNLKPLFKYDEFKKLKEYYNSKESKIPSIELLRDIVSLPKDGYKVKGFVSSLGHVFDFQDVTKLKNSNKEYRELLQKIYDNYFRLYDEPYRNYDVLHPETHYEMIQAVFREAHGYNGVVDKKKLEEVNGLIKILKNSLNNSYYKARNLVMINNFRNDSFFKYILEELF
ncbi:hypothetical protein NNC19_05470 [Clostridium sp. SHJSY1]|uniref:hypothetical protein n=1 Tax=Clostridium sp. SHJSY1 TaxID=2942483 RepID=UPI002875B4AD|nr:hypothetical protein [Clostridium sp. SHJSY1]MDS0525123.1 hypothetical protein [Clostridium sp. SHJSY1]